MGRADEDRQQRLAAALRENLRRRKAAARSREADDGGDPQGGTAVEPKGAAPKESPGGD